MIIAGKITISRVTNNKTGDYIEIHLKDSRAAITFAEAKLTLEDFAMAITGMGYTPCEIEVKGLQNIGKQHQHKTEVVFIPDHGGDRDEHNPIVRKAIELYEIDGWRGRDSDAHNHHNWTRKEPPKGKKGRWTSITFVRWVEVTEEETA